MKHISILFLLSSNQKIFVRLQKKKKKGSIVTVIYRASYPRTGHFNFHDSSSKSCFVYIKTNVSLILKRFSLNRVKSLSWTGAILILNLFNKSVGRWWWQSQFTTDFYFFFMIDVAEFLKESPRLLFKKSTFSLSLSPKEIYKFTILITLVFPFFIYNKFRWRVIMFYDLCKGIIFWWRIFLTLAVFTRGIHRAFTLRNTTRLRNINWFLT